MATQLNIKDPVLIEQVRTLAKRRGQPVTATLRAIVGKEWAASEAEGDERLARMYQWAREVQAQLPPEVKGMTSKQVMDLIYDENELDGFAK